MTGFTPISLAQFSLFACLWLTGSATGRLSLCNNRNATSCEITGSQSKQNQDHHSGASHEPLSCNESLDLKTLLGGWHQKTRAIWHFRGLVCVVVQVWLSFNKIKGEGILIYCKWAHESCVTLIFKTWKYTLSVQMMSS